MFGKKWAIKWKLSELWLMYSWQHDFKKPQLRLYKHYYGCTVNSDIDTLLSILGTTDKTKKKLGVKGSGNLSKHPVVQSRGCYIRMFK